jgi:uncharacterized protein (TIGR02246 family)
MNLSTGPAEITTRFQEAWNMHDMEAFGRLFHPDATFVNRFGTYWRGVDKIVAGHTRSIRRSIAIRRLRSTCPMSIRSLTMRRSCISGRASAPAPAPENVLLTNPMTGAAILCP